VHDKRFDPPRPIRTIPFARFAAPATAATGARLSPELDIVPERFAGTRVRVRFFFNRRNMMASSMQGRTLDKRETINLIGSDKVEGTPVYRSNGERVGQIERIMIDKLSGKVAYAVMSFGGFLGIGEDYYPLPWSLLTFNPALDGYEVNVSEQQLKGAPKFSKYENWDWSDPDRGREVYDYFGLTPLQGS
jgi:hypothetical protein